MKTSNEWGTFLDTTLEKLNKIGMDFPTDMNWTNKELNNAYQEGHDIIEVEIHKMCDGTRMYFMPKHQTVDNIQQAMSQRLYGDPLNKTNEDTEGSTELTKDTLLVKFVIDKKLMQWLSVVTTAFVDVME